MGFYLQYVYFHVVSKNFGDSNVWRTETNSKLFINCSPIYNIYTDTHAHTIAQCKLLTLDIKLVHSIVGANNYEYLFFFSPIPFFSLCHSLIKIWKRNIHITHCAIVRQKKHIMETIKTNVANCRHIPKWKGQWIEAKKIKNEIKNRNLEFGRWEWDSIQNSLYTQ